MTGVDGALAGWRDAMAAALATRRAQVEALWSDPAHQAALLTLLAAAAAVAALALWLAAARPARRRARALAAEAATLRETADATARALAEATARLDALAPLRDERDAAQTRAQAAESRAAALDATLTAAREETARRVADLQALREEVERKFDTLAQAALDASSKRFLSLAEERMARQKEDAAAALETRKTEIAALVKPVHESLTKFETRVGEIEKAREGAYAAIREQVEALRLGQTGLREETARLVGALRQPKTRGAWGELQLRRVFELAGMTEHVDFDTETSIDTEAGRRRPDATVTLPGGRTLVIDAKTPLDAYLNALEAPDDATREMHLTRHARQLRDQMKILSGKEYWKLFDDTPDFVVMFVPGEAFYSVAMERDTALFEDAMASRVVIASPTTLVALAKSVAYGWRQEALSRDARAIFDTARELYARIDKFGEHFGKVGKALENATRSFNAAVGSMESRVLPAMRKLEDLKVPEAGAEIAAPDMVETEPRPLAATELAGPPPPED